MTKRLILGLAAAMAFLHPSLAVGGNTWGQDFVETLEANQRHRELVDALQDIKNAADAANVQREFDAIDRNYYDNMARINRNYYDELARIDRQSYINQHINDGLFESHRDHGYDALGYDYGYGPPR